MKITKNQFQDNFENLNEVEQYEYIVNYEDKADLLIVLDNDTTYVQSMSDEDFYFVTKDDIGDRAGIISLLKAIGITAEYC